MKLTWLGHAAFRIEITDAVILIDPFFTGNPKFPGDVATASRDVTHIVLTHGHGDHVGDTVAIARKTGAKVIGDADLVSYLARQGVENVDPMNSGGTVDEGPFRVSLTIAHHSSGSIDANGVVHSLGSAHGAIIRAPGERTLYHAGDTDIFSDMALIDEIYEPRIGILPIGDRFTMGGKVAAMAARRFFHFETVIPGHYATFPMVDPTAAAFEEGMRGSGVEVLLPPVGEAVTL